MKGIILAGGAGSRLYPMTQVVTKQLQTVYDKPMIYYPLGLLMLCGIKEILLISTEKDIPLFKTLLGDGRSLGLHIEYKVQNGANGIAEAYILGEEFLAGQAGTLILGDNLFYGRFSGFREAVQKQAQGDQLKARVFAYPVADPERYGVVEFDKKSMKVVSIEEKPQRPKSKYAIPGLYILDETAPRRAKELRPSPRGELEITDLIKTYLSEGTLGVEVIGRGMAWFDTGTPQSLLEASSFIGAIEQRQGLKVACLEEIAFKMGFLSETELERRLEEIPSCSYRTYLENVLMQKEER